MNGVVEHVMGNMMWFLKSINQEAQELRVRLASNISKFDDMGKSFSLSGFHFLYLKFDWVVPDENLLSSGDSILKL